ncbi:hypothetical protein [Roseospira visakhapatnamensis]|uniref:Ribokinase n=1 Tax=Roseospira visakhapatnamensis TaxID=390880 RepID=A0A7W6RD23_9PROT|nr:hypothetical protein [Roseospira visakhapatnamensis]MBB4266227.1 hypothetical protein [Roseospira visakhapatnamensis]
MTHVLVMGSLNVDEKIPVDAPPRAGAHLTAGPGHLCPGGGPAAGGAPGHAVGGATTNRPLILVDPDGERTPIARRTLAHEAVPVPHAEGRFSKSVDSARPTS